MNSDYLTITNSYWVPDLMGVSMDVGVIAKYGTQRTVNELKQKSNYTDWDFTNVWSIDQGTTLPYLLGNRENEIMIGSIDSKRITKETEGETSLQLTTVPEGYIGIYNATDLMNVTAGAGPHLSSRPCISSSTRT